MDSKNAKLSKGLIRTLKRFAKDSILVDSKNSKLSDGLRRTLFWWIRHSQKV